RNAHADLDIYSPYGEWSKNVQIAPTRLIRVAADRRLHADGAGRRVGFDMADADVPADDAQIRRDPGTLAREVDDRLPARFRADFDVRPGDPAAPARPQHFEHRLFGGKT